MRLVHQLHSVPPVVNGVPQHKHPHLLESVSSEGFDILAGPPGDLAVEVASIGYTDYSGHVSKRDVFLVALKFCSFRV